MFLYYFYIYRVKSLTTLLYVERHRVIFTDLIDQTRNMHKDLALVIILFDKTKSFCCIKKFYCAFFLHYIFFELLQR